MCLVRTVVVRVGQVGLRSGRVLLLQLLGLPDDRARELVGVDLDGERHVPRAEEQMTALRAMHALLPPDAANGANCNQHWDWCHPYVDLGQIWADEPAGTPRVARAFATEVDGRFYVGVMGLRSTYEIEAGWDMTIEVFSAVDGTLLERVTLDKGQRHTFREVDGLRDFVHQVTPR